jgi:hypothetical protein
MPESIKSKLHATRRSALVSSILSFDIPLFFSTLLTTILLNIGGQSQSIQHVLIGSMNPVILSTIALTVTNLYTKSIGYTSIMISITISTIICMLIMHYNQSTIEFVYKPLNSYEYNGGSEIRHKKVKKRCRIKNDTEYETRFDLSDFSNDEIDDFQGENDDIYNNDVYDDEDDLSLPLTLKRVVSEEENLVLHPDIMEGYNNYIKNKDNNTTNNKLNLFDLNGSQSSPSSNSSSSVYNDDENDDFMGNAPNYNRRRGMANILLLGSDSDSMSLKSSEFSDIMNDHNSIDSSNNEIKKDKDNKVNNYHDYSDESDDLNLNKDVSSSEEKDYNNVQILDNSNSFNLSENDEDIIKDNNNHNSTKDTDHHKEYKYKINDKEVDDNETSFSELSFDDEEEREGDVTLDKILDRVTHRFVTDHGRDPNQIEIKDLQESSQVMFNNRRNNGNNSEILSSDNVNINSNASSYMELSESNEEDYEISDDDSDFIADE